MVILRARPPSAVPRPWAGVSRPRQVAITAGVTRFGSGLLQQVIESILNLNDLLRILLGLLIGALLLLILVLLFVLVLAEVVNLQLVLVEGKELGVFAVVHPLISLTD